ncbi:MAG: hypothetical protein PWQ91_199 [Eubacteriales bacterium]|nr:hypothetical protein [Eubacteriales bacterium]MDN5363138.1 hypothetical protein [Eubacteriales bacterium]
MLFKRIPGRDGGKVGFIPPLLRQVAGGTLILLVLAAGGIWFWPRTVTVKADGKTVQVRTGYGRVEDVLKKAGIRLAPEDLVRPSLSSKVFSGMTVTVKRAVPVVLVVDGRKQSFKTTADTVAEVLEQKKVRVGKLDRVLPDRKAKIEKGMEIRVIRVVVKEQEYTEEIPYGVEHRQDNTMDYGQSKVLRPGEKGLMKYKVRIVYEDGREAAREILEQTVLKKPVSEIVALGTVRFRIGSRGEKIRYYKAVQMLATGYTHTGCRTASGTMPYRGVAAVDPSVIPLGTKLYVEGYGYVIAADKGSAIRGNRIDLFFETATEARTWGQRWVTVYFLAE